jgi:hypothetical protein
MSVCPFLPLRERFVVFAALPLQIGATGVLAMLWRRGYVARAAAVLLLLVGATSAGQRLAWVLDHEVANLEFVESSTPEDAVILTDPPLANAVAGLTGRRIVAPEGPDLFLILAGGWQRNVDAERFFAPDVARGERMTILERWDVTHVLLDRLATGHPQTLPFGLVAEEAGYTLYDVRRPSP